jgi:hypothetical protein
LLEQLLEAVGNEQTVFIVENEEAADALIAIGIPATTNGGGWHEEFNAHLRDADVVLVPDNTDGGWRVVNQIGISLKNVAKRTRVLLLPKKPTDWLDAGGTREQFDVLVEEASDWTSPVVTDSSPESEPSEAEKSDAKAREDELIAALSNTKGLEYHRLREAAKKELGVTAKAIDNEVKARRDKTSPLHGFWIVEPAPGPVDGSSLLRDIMLRLQRHIICSPNDALAIALWIMFSWVHDEVATHSPILNITSAEPESGKSTTLGLITFLAPRCLPSVEISEAALYRSISFGSRRSPLTSSTASSRATTRRRCARSSTAATRAARAWCGVSNLTSGRSISRLSVRSVSGWSAASFRRLR